MKLFTISSSLVIILGIAGTNFVAPTVAGQLANGTVFFEGSPRLLEAYSSISDARAWGAKYYFTIELPDNAVEPLQKVVIQQRGGSELIRFRVERTLAFSGTPDLKGESFSLEAINITPKKQEIELVFQEPISPGTTFTVGIIPKKNPRYAGVYLFGVTAFPRGEKSNPTYLGVGRFHFYRGRGGLYFYRDGGVINLH